MKVVVHCGLHKTGTTSFQKQAYLSNLKLRDAGIYYPAPGNASWPFAQHSQLAFFIMQEQRGPLTEYLEQIAEDATAHHWHTVLLSGEEFSSAARNPGEFEFFLGELRRLFDELEVVLVIRDLVSHTASNIMEDVFAGTIVLRNRPGVDYECERRIIQTAETTADFARRSDTRVLRYAELVKDRNLCHALMAELVGPLPFDIEDTEINTFEEKIVEAANFALAPVRAANTIVYGPDARARMETLVNRDAFNSSFNGPQLLELATDLKRTMSDIARDAVERRRDDINTILAGHPTLFEWLITR